VVVADYGLWRQIEGSAPAEGNEIALVIGREASGHYLLK
jgi:hypothetical protein